MGLSVQEIKKLSFEDLALATANEIHRLNIRYSENQFNKAERLLPALLEMMEKQQREIETLKINNLHPRA